jgi:CheY-like chemotaxis protein
MERAFLKLQSCALLQFVPNGVEAIHYLEGKGIYHDRDCYPFPDLILLDVKMPKVDGFEVLQWIKAHPRFKKLIVVMLTGSDEPMDIQKAYELGANSYLVKSPLHPEFTDLVKSMVSYWLQHNRACQME